MAAASTAGVAVMAGVIVMAIMAAAVERPSSPIAGGAAIQRRRGGTRAMRMRSVGMGGVGMRGVGMGAAALIPVFVCRHVSESFSLHIHSKHLKVTIRSIR